MRALVETIKAHGTEAKIGEDGKLYGLAVFTYREGAEVLTGSEWECLEATPSAVRAWLGY